MSKVEFVSYDGAYPNLCSGTLVLSIDGALVVFPHGSMSSGGSVWFDDNWFEHVDCGPWTVSVPEKYASISKEIDECVNANVPHGCCGGCV